MRIGYAVRELAAKHIQRLMSFVTRRLNLNRTNLVSLRQQKIYLIIVLAAFGRHGIIK